MLQGVRRCVARAGLWHCQRARFRVNGRWYSSPFDELASLLPSTALLNNKGKQRGRSWGQWAGHTGFGFSAGSWMRLNHGVTADAQGGTLISGRLACATKHGVSRGTSKAPGALQQRAGQCGGTQERVGKLLTGRRHLPIA